MGIDSNLDIGVYIAQIPLRMNRLRERLDRIYRGDKMPSAKVVNKQILDERDRILAQEYVKRKIELGEITGPIVIDTRLKSKKD